MVTMSAEEARTNFSDVVKRAKYGRQRTIVTTHGKKAAAIIPVEELELLELLLERLEYRKDVIDARAALEEIEKEGTVSLEEWRQSL